MDRAEREIEAIPSDACFTSNLSFLYAFLHDLLFQIAFFRTSALVAHAVVKARNSLIGGLRFQYHL